MLACELDAFHLAVKAAGGERGENPAVQVEAWPRIVHSAAKAAGGEQGINPVVQVDARLRARHVPRCGESRWW